ncbi:MAG TPA: hypothetical protein VFJ72_11035, partial [Rubrobacteraceae bacterium]|nr:hypothetical protein [Rubrobacteraceae bacterium]
LDVTDRARMREVVERFAPLREDPAILVYNAGISPVYASAEKVDEGDWYAIIATNLTGASVVPRGVEHQPVACEEVRRRDHDDLYRSRLSGMEIKSAAGETVPALFVHRVGRRTRWTSP